jgi:hypothetical protein
MSTPDCSTGAYGFQRLPETPSRSGSRSSSPWARWLPSAPWLFPNAHPRTRRASGGRNDARTVKTGSADGAHSGRRRGGHGTGGPSRQRGGAGDQCRQGGWQTRSRIGGHSSRTCPETRRNGQERQVTQRHHRKGSEREQTRRSRFDRPHARSRSRAQHCQWLRL